MIEYSDFVAWSYCSITSTEFPKYESRCAEFLESLCGDNWSESDEICVKALMYQIEYVFQNGGLAMWSSAERSGSVESESYRTGGESESRRYTGVKRQYALALAPMAEQLLKRSGYMEMVGRVWVNY